MVRQPSRDIEWKPEYAFIVICLFCEVSDFSSNVGTRQWQTVTKRRLLLPTMLHVTQMSNFISSPSDRKRRKRKKFKQLYNTTQQKEKQTDLTKARKTFYLLFYVGCRATLTACHVGPSCRLSKTSADTGQSLNTGPCVCALSYNAHEQSLSLTANDNFSLKMTSIDRQWIQFDGCFDTVGRATARVNQAGENYSDYRQRFFSGRTWPRTTQPGVNSRKDSRLNN